MISRLITFLIAIAIATAARASNEYQESIVPFLENHCFDCHDDLSTSGDLDLSRFFTEEEVIADRAVWASVYEKVESYQMPPPKRKGQPSEEERSQLLDWITGIAERPDPQLGTRDPGKPVLRRLTRLEYNNTVRDLLELDVDLFIFPERLKFADRSYFRPESETMGRLLQVPMREYGGKYRVLVSQAGLPGDSRAAHGFRNRGEAMDFSPLLLEKYVEMAGNIVRAEELPIRSPKFATLLGLDPGKIPSLPDRRPKPPGYRDAPVIPLTLGFAPDIEGAKKPDGAPDGINGFRKQVEEAYEEGRGGVVDLPSFLGVSTIAGKGGLLKAGYGNREMTVNPNEDLWIAGFGTATESSSPFLLTNKNKNEKVFELTLEIRGGDLGEGIERLGLCVLGRNEESGPVTLTAKFSDGTEAGLSAEISEGAEGTTFFSFAAIPGETITRLHVDGSEFSGEFVLLDDIGFVTNGAIQNRELITTRSREIRLAAENPTSETVLEKPEPATLSNAPEKTARERLAEFVGEAFRRAVTPEEIDRFHALYESAKQSGKVEPDAMRIAIQAVLSSPGFLFLEMNGIPAANEPVTTLDDFELANRLAYFLWSSMPDAELIAAAEAGNLSTDPAELEQQARRMLRDPRVKELSESFASQWLRLDQLYTAQPDRDLFETFYSGPQGKTTMHSSALVEPLLLFETVLVENRSILEFVNPGYTWLNEGMVSLYEAGEFATPQFFEISGRDPAEERQLAEAAQSNREVRQRLQGRGSEWYRIDLPDADRGGFLAMSGPLTVTSLPFRTSPVKRGAWLLETIFNRPPTEPKEAFVIENDTKEAALSVSIRETFEKHRSHAACFSCHVRLDPPGFALESFDPIGVWRETDAGAPVDAGGEWNGVTFEGPAEFKQLIVRDPHEFARGFIEHLLSYALSR
ncbi:MAG: DUF1592 domain-containing protein, partial [Verrucomicrobiota bacterium]